MKTKGFFFIVVLGFMLSGCSTTWHVNKARSKCPECFELDTTIKHVVFKMDTVIHLDTNILVLLPRDTVKYTKILPKYIGFKPEKVKNGIITVEVSAYKGRLNVVSYLDSAILFRLKKDIRLKDAIIRDLREVTIKQSIIIAEKKTFIERLKSNIQYGFILLFVIVGLIIIYKLYKT